MTAEEVFESVTNGGASDFAAAAEIFEHFGPWCLIGGLTVNCYAEPLYTVDTDFVVVAQKLGGQEAALTAAGFTWQRVRHSVDARRAGSKLNLQLTTDSRYQSFPGRAERHEVLGRVVPVASLRDVVQGKVWAWPDPERRMTKRKKGRTRSAPAGRSTSAATFGNVDRNHPATASR